MTTPLTDTESNPGDSDIATLVDQTAATGVRASGVGNRRLAYVVGALVVTAGAVAILLSANLPTTKPATTPGSQSASLAPVPPMSDSVGNTDRHSYSNRAFPVTASSPGLQNRTPAPVDPALPVSHGLSFYDRVQASAASTPRMSNGIDYFSFSNRDIPAAASDLGLQNRIQAPVDPTLPVSHGLSFHERIQTSAATLPRMSNGIDYFSFSNRDIPATGH